MAFVITERCIGERYAACAAVCPVDCIYPGDYQGEPFMVIDPEACIDCGLCLPECPVGSIVASAAESPQWARINTGLAPAFVNNPPAPLRPRDGPPRMPGNVIINP
ncbi:MAG TPA: ferredoxin family protein [Candidatus Kapabacteria bacterium]|nr:ferredoxin family protein [Candidatus Kapabacteria bacterium]